jgi:ABC-type Fe3+ transport system substrate-binding protein
MKVGSTGRFVVSLAPFAGVEFEKETGVKVGLTLKGPGESFAQIAAECANPKPDLWFGGTGDPHVQAAKQGLTQECKSPRVVQLQPGAQRQAEQSKYRRSGIYPGVPGIGYDTEPLARKKIAMRAKQFQLPSNVNTPLSPKSADIKFINYDFAKSGAPAERRRLLERWDKDIGSQVK